MADQFSKMYDVERVGGDQRQRLAEMLRANALNVPQGQMVGNWYVKPSWTQNLAHLANTAVGVFGGAAVDQERKDTAARLLREISEGIPVEPTPQQTVFNNIEQMQPEGQTPAPQQSALAQLVRGNKPTEPVEITQATMRQPEQPKFRPLTEDERLGKVMELARVDPMAAQIWSAQDTAKQARLNKAEERAADREFKREQLQAQLEGRMDLARLTGAIAASNRIPASEKPLTEYQGKAVTFGTRAAQSHNILNALEGNVSPTAVMASRKGGMAENWALDPQTRQVEQAQRDFINAVLRQESGAAIGQNEYESAARQYFPEPNDPPEVVAQKRASREAQIRGFTKQAGPAGAPDIVNAFNTPYALPQTKEQAAPRGRLGTQSTMPPNTKVKFLGFE